jgi:hypothetical protein
VVFGRSGSADGTVEHQILDALTVTTRPEPLPGHGPDEGYDIRGQDTKGHDTKGHDTEML